MTKAVRWSIIIRNFYDLKDYFFVDKRRIVMNLKKVANIKNIACLVAVIGLAAGINLSERHKRMNDVQPADSSSAAGISSETEESKADSSKKDDGKETVTLAASIPELSCKAVDLDGNVVFADPMGNYSFLKDGKNATGITVNDDSGANVAFDMKDGKLTISRGSAPADGFVYKKHLIELKDGKLYYDSSPVEYKSDSFSAYKLSDKYTVESVGVGKYRLRDASGKVTDTCEIKESNGNTLKIVANDEGFDSEGVSDGLFYNVYRMGEDIILTSWGHRLYINGKELLPYGSGDTYVNSELEIDYDKIELVPAKPPVDFGSTATSNEGISDLTNQMLGMVNAVRKQYDLKPVYGLSRLDKAAEVRVGELAAKFDHSRPDDDKSYSTVLESADLEWWESGENIAKGGETVEEVFNSWMSSKEHRALILDPSMKYMALAKTEDSGEMYWEQLFFNDTYIPAQSV